MCRRAAAEARRSGPRTVMRDETLFVDGHYCNVSVQLMHNQHLYMWSHFIAACARSLGQDALVGHMGSAVAL